MSAAQELFDQFGITYVPPAQQRRRDRLETCCRAIVDRMIAKHGVGHMTLVLRTIVETDGNGGELVADTIKAVSHVILAHIRWADQGEAWLAAFDKIDLAGIRCVAKAAKARPLFAGIVTLLCVELERLLGPSKLPKPPRPAKLKKAPRSETRIPEVKEKVALGVELLARQAAATNNMQISRIVRDLGIDQADASRCTRVARIYADRDEIVTKLSWPALVELSSPSLPANVRRQLEQQILAGERVTAPAIRRARGQLSNGRPRHQSDQASPQMAA